MSKHFVVALLLLTACATNRTANVKTPGTQVQAGEMQEELIEITAEGIVAEPVAVSETDGTSSFEPVKNIQFNPRYAVYERINDQYDWYWEKNSNNRYTAQGVVDKNGNVILPHLFSKGLGPRNTYELLLSLGPNNYGLYNLKELRWSIPIGYQELSSLGNNLYLAKKDYKYGVIDNNNSTIVPFTWGKMEKMHNLDHYVRVSNGEFWGVYSIFEKRLTIPVEYTFLMKLDRENYFLVKKGTKTNVVDINNKPLFKRWYEEIRVSPMNVNYFIVKDNNLYGVIDYNEKVIVPITFMEYSENYFADGSYLARNKEGKYGFMLIDGRVTLPFNYDNLKRGYANNVVSIQNGKCGLVRVNTGTPVEILTCDFDNIYEGSKTFIVEKDGKYGLLNLYGEQITPIIYASLEPMKDGYYSDIVTYLAQEGKYYRLLNEQGKSINEEDFTEIAPLTRKSQASSYDNQRFTYFKVKAKNGKYGVMDKVGKIIAEPKFDDILAEDDNITIVRSKQLVGMYSLLAQKLLLGYEYETIVKANDTYVGLKGKNIDLLVIKSDQVVKTSTMSQ